jgi:hypothetical protein
MTPTPEASEWEEPTAVLVARGVLGSAQDAARTTFTIENAQAVHDAWDAYDAAVRAALVAEMQAEPSVPSGEAVACVKRLAYWANLWAEQGSDETLNRDIVDGDERVALASLLAAPPQERVSEVTEAMVKAGVQAFDAGVPWLDVQGQVRAILTAALAPSRRAPSGDGGGRDA